MESVCHAVQGEVARVTLNGPPINVLGFGLRHDLASALERAMDEASVRAIALAGHARFRQSAPSLVRLANVGETFD